MSDLIVVVDDQRRFTDNREAVYIREPEAAIKALSQYLNTGTEIKELYLDYSLLGDDVSEVLYWLKNHAEQGASLIQTVIPVSNNRDGRDLIRLVLSKTYNVLDDPNTLDVPGYYGLKEHR